MTRIVLDTNVIVSAALRSDGNEAAVLRLVADGQVTLCGRRNYRPAELPGVVLLAMLSVGIDFVLDFLDKIDLGAWLHKDVPIGSLIFADARSGAGVCGFDWCDLLDIDVTGSAGCADLWEV